MTRRWTRGFASFGCLLLTAALVAPSSSVLAAAPARPPTVTEQGARPQRIQAGLTERARDRGQVRVIVNFRQGRPLTNVMTAAARRELRRSVSRTSRQVAGIAASTGGTVVRRYRYLPAMAMSATPRTLSALRASPYVRSVAADERVRRLLHQTVPLVQADAAAAVGWAGTDQIVAVLDTGVEADHPFLAGAIVGEACFAAGDPASPPSSGGDCPNGLATQTGTGAAAPCPWTGCRHGTHVSGIAVGRPVAEPESGHAPIAGVARDASLLAIQVFSHNPSTNGITTAYSDVAAAMEYVYAHPTIDGKRVASVNLSLGGSFALANCDTASNMLAMKAAVDLLRTLGIATVIAAGNNGYVDAISQPACISTAISVASTTKSDAVSSFSNLSSVVSLEAPGTGIYSSLLGSAYGQLDGTSMAAPHVAGAWAVLRSRFPNASVGIVLKALQSTGTAITDQRYPGANFDRVTKRRIRIQGAGDWLGATRTSLSRSTSSVSSGHKVTLTVTASRAHTVGQKPTGKVRFKVGGVVQATRTIDPATGTASYSATISGPRGRSVTVQAVYLGDGRFLRSQTPALKVTIR